MLQADGNVLDAISVQAVGVLAPYQWLGWQPYLKGGLGLTALWARSVDVSEGNVKVNGVGMGPSALLGAGLTKQLSEHWAIDAGYQGLYVPPTKVDGLSTHYLSHGVMVFLRVNWGS